MKKNSNYVLKLKGDKFDNSKKNETVISQLINLFVNDENYNLENKEYEQEKIINKLSRDYKFTNNIDKEIENVNYEKRVFEMAFDVPQIYMLRLFTKLYLNNLIQSNSNIIFEKVMELKQA